MSERIVEVKLPLVGWSAGIVAETAVHRRRQSAMGDLLDSGISIVALDGIEYRYKPIPKPKQLVWRASPDCPWRPATLTDFGRQAALAALTQAGGIVGYLGDEFAWEVPSE